MLLVPSKQPVPDVTRLRFVHLSNHKLLVTCNHTTTWLWSCTLLLMPDSLSKSIEIHLGSFSVCPCVLMPYAVHSSYRARKAQHLVVIVPSRTRLNLQLSNRTSLSYVPFIALWCPPPSLGASSRLTPLQVCYLYQRFPTPTTAPPNACQANSVGFVSRLVCICGLLAVGHLAFDMNNRATRWT